MAMLYGPLYEEIWRRALLRAGFDDLFASLASELADARGISQADAESALVTAWEGEASRAARVFPAAASDSELAAYYSSEAPVPVALYWHSLRPNRYALHSVAGLHALQQFAEGPRVYEHGHGIGSTAILFARHGLDLTLGEVSPVAREFASRRLSERGIDARFVDVSREELDPASFDAVVSFDVLEHIPNALEEVRRLHALLVEGGVLVMNVAFGRDSANPEHLLARRLGFVDRIRGIGFERIVSPTLLVFYKRRVSRSRAAAYRVRDVVGVAGEDAVARWPSLQRLRQWRVPGGVDDPPS